MIDLSISRTHIYAAQSGLYSSEAGVDGRWKEKNSDVYDLFCSSNVGKDNFRGLRAW